MNRILKNQSFGLQIEILSKKFSKNPRLCLKKRQRLIDQLNKFSLQDPKRKLYLKLLLMSCVDSLSVDLKGIINQAIKKDIRLKTAGQAAEILHIFQDENG